MHAFEQVWVGMREIKSLVGVFFHIVKPIVARRGPSLQEQSQYGIERGRVMYKGAGGEKVRALSDGEHVTEFNVCAGIVTQFPRAQEEVVTECIGRGLGSSQMEHRGEYVDQLDGVLQMGLAFAGPQEHQGHVRGAF